MFRFSDLTLPERIGLPGLYAFLFFAWESKARAAVSFLFVLIPCLLDRRFWRSLRASPTAWVIVLLLFYILLRGLAASIENPQYLHYHLKDGWELMLLCGFVFIGWLLRGDQRRVFLALAIALLGFWVGRLEHFPWNEAFQGGQWWTTRIKLGLPSEIGFGIYTAAASIGLVLLAPRIWSLADRSWQHLLIVICWALFLLLSVQGLIMAQSRAVWLAVALLVCTLPVAYLLFMRRSHWHKVIGIMACVVALLGIFAYANQGALSMRFSEEIDTTLQMLAGDFDEIEAIDQQGEIKSMGIRYHMLLFGIEHWQENPWFGLGPGISKPLIKEHWVASKTFNHLHNNYLEMLLRLGIVGTGLIFAMLALIVHGSWRAYRKQRLDADLFLFLIAALVLPLLVSFASFRMLHTDWRYYWFLVGGTLYGFALLSSGYDRGSTATATAARSGLTQTPADQR